LEEKAEAAQIIVSGDSSTNKTIKHFYVSEKASRLTSINQYVFKVHKSANKSEVKKQVSKLFNVNVIDVKMINVPRKRRSLGRHPGFKTGFKKAIVVLQKGQSIQQGQHKV